MAYDEDLADRIRAVLATRRDVSEKRMFGGLAFLIGGHMAVAASRSGQLMARVDPAESERLVEADGVSRMVMRGREMAGWLRVDAEVTESDDALREWVERGVAFVQALPD